MARSGWVLGCLIWALPGIADARDEAEPAAEAPAAAVDDGIGPVGSNGRHTRVDRLSEHMPEPLGEVPDGYVPPTREERPGVKTTEVVFDVPDRAQPDVQRIRLMLDVPDEPRLLLVDSGPIFFTTRGDAWVPVPNQQVVVSPPKTVAIIDALPLVPDTRRPRPGQMLSSARITDPGLMAVLRTVQRIESDDVHRLRKYVRDDGAGGYTVETRVRNEDVRVAGWMVWTRGPDGKPRGTLPRDAVRMAIYAVTAGYTIQDIADWLRTRRKMDMEPAIAAARALARQSEFILERAGLQFRTLSPRHAEFAYNQGIAAFEKGDLERAEKLFRQAIEKQREMVDAHNNLGITLYRAGKYDDANNAFLVASGLDGAPAAVFFNRGATLFRTGDLLGAARQFRKVLEKEPDNTDAKAWLDKADPEGKTAPPPKKKKKKRKRRRRR